MQTTVKSPKNKIGVGGLVISPRAKRYVNKVLASNRLSYGTFSKKFEAKFAKAHDVKFACFMNSGTDALRVTLSAMKDRYDWKDGDEVIVPAITFVATSNIVIQNNLKPVFADVDPLTYNIDPRDIERRVTARTRAIIPVHLMGLPADMDPIMQLARKHRLQVLEDSCEAMFAEYKGKKVGALGHAAAFSTYVAHYLVTGVGGIATTNDPELAIDIRSFMNHGRDPAYLSIDADRNVSDEELRDIVSKRFKFVHVGYSSRCTELEAALGLAQLEESKGVLAARRAIAYRYSEAFKDLSDHLQLPTEPKGFLHSFMLYPIVMKKEDKTGLIQYLERHKVETRDLMPLLSQPIYKKLFGDLERHYPVAERLARAGFYIGCHQHLSPKDQSYIIARVHDYFRKR